MHDGCLVKSDRERMSLHTADIPRRQLQSRIKIFKYQRNDRLTLHLDLETVGSTPGLDPEPYQSRNITAELRIVSPLYTFAASYCPNLP